MSDKVFITNYGIDEIDFFIALLKENFSQFSLRDLTNGMAADSIQINSVHPLSMVFEQFVQNGETMNYSSVLPAIGVESVSESQDKNLMGAKGSYVAVTKEFIDNLKDVRVPDRVFSGYIATDTNLNKVLKEIQACKDNGLDFALADENYFLLSQQVRISLWSDNIAVRNLVYKIVRAILYDFKSKSIPETSKVGVVNISIDGVSDLYNLETGKLLYGGEFTVRFINFLRNIKIPLNNGEYIKNVEASMNLPSNEEGKLKFTFINPTKEGKIK